MPVLKFEDPPCVMVRIPKTGTTSIYQGLLGGAEHSRVLGRFPSEWQNEYSFTFVRNPFDRLVSAYLMFSRYRTANDSEDSIRANLSLHSVMDIVEDESIGLEGDDYLSKLRRHCIPMTSAFFCHEMIQDIFRFEAFQRDFQRLATRLGINVTVVPHLRRTDREHYACYYSAEERERAERVFAKDAQLFGYQFETPDRESLKDGTRS